MSTDNSTQNIDVYNENADKYDLWFERHPYVFQSELHALRKVVPKSGMGIEIGVGTGRFAEVLGIRHGVEPAENMRRYAQSRGIEVKDGRAEDLPYESDCFDFALMITTLCFVDNPVKSLEEAKRVLKKGGKIIIGIIDRTAALGKLYESKMRSNSFYHNAHLFAADEVNEMLIKVGFKEIEAYQTLFCDPDQLENLEEIKTGFGQGLFVVFGATVAQD